MSGEADGSGAGSGAARALSSSLPADSARRLRAGLAGLERGRAYLAGVSGGADSVFLLHALSEAGFRRVIVCHLDHGLRGADSDADAEFVGRLAAGLGCEFRLERAELGARRAAGGVELAGRRARHRMFARVAREAGVSGVILGHHGDDKAETILFNLLRGAGKPGLGSLRPQSELDMDGLRMSVLRPLLALRAAEIRAGLEAAGLPWCEDASNARSEHARNRLRHEALPLLSSIMERDAVAAILRHAQIAEEEDDYIEQQAAAVELGATIEVRAFRGLPRALQRRQLKRWLEGRGVGGVGYREIEAVLGLFELDGGAAKVNLPGDRHARRRAGRVFCEPEGDSG